MRKSKGILFITMLFFLTGAFSMLFMSLHYFQIDVTGVIKGKVVAYENWYGHSLRAHIVFGISAIFLGPFQFIEAIRNKNIKIHRIIGYLYAFSVLFSGIFGLVVAQFPMGGVISQLGFSALAIFWLYSLIKSILSVRKKKIQEHRKWMFINYALTFAAIPQRTLLLVPLLVNIDFMDIYRLSAWLPWVLNTIIATGLHQRIMEKERQTI